MLPAKTPPVLLRSAKIQGYRPLGDFLATFDPLEILVDANKERYQSAKTGVSYDNSDY